MKRKIYGYLKVRLKEENITNVELARELNMEPATLSNKLNGKAGFRINELEQILDKINETDPDEICKLLNLNKKKIA